MDGGSLDDIDCAGGGSNVEYEKPDGGSRISDDDESSRLSSAGASRLPPPPLLLPLHLPMEGGSRSSAAGAKLLLCEINKKPSHSRDLPDRKSVV